LDKQYKDSYIKREWPKALKQFNANDFLEIILRSQEFCEKWAGSSQCQDKAVAITLFSLCGREFLKAFEGQEGQNEKSKYEKIIEEWEEISNFDENEKRGLAIQHPFVKLGFKILSTDDESKEWITNKLCKANRNLTELNDLSQEERKQFITKKIESLKKRASDLEFYAEIKEKINQLYNEWMNNEVQSDDDEMLTISQDMSDTDIQMNIEY